MTNPSTIIIGAGHNSLVCGAYLAKAGHQVTIFEAANKVGGAAITREFTPGFKVSAGAHLLYLLDEGIRKDLGLEAQGLTMAKQGMDTISLDINRQHVRISETGVDGVSSDDQAAMKEYRRKMNRFAGVIGALHNRTPPRMGTTDREDLLALGRIGWNIRKMGKDDMREFLRITIEHGWHTRHFPRNAFQ
jgi:phytoene dehydrogenase-like protein